MDSHLDNHLQLLDIPVLPQRVLCPFCQMRKTCGYHDEWEMSEAVDYTAEDMSTDGVDFEVCIVDIKVQPV